MLIILEISTPTWELVVRMVKEVHTSFEDGYFQTYSACKPIPIDWESPGAWSELGGGSYVWTYKIALSLWTTRYIYVYVYIVNLSCFLPPVHFKDLGVYSPR